MEHFEEASRPGPNSVVVAEEDPRLRRIIRLYLEREGFNAVEACSLADCQALLRGSNVGLVIVSVQLPGFDVLQFSEWLRSEFPHKPVPVVLLSFEPEDRLLTRGLRLGAFRQKPFDPGELVGQATRLMQAV